MKIIAFSLWGDGLMYTVGAIKNAELAKTIFPGWICRFYIGQSTPEETIQKLEEFDNVQVVRMDVPGDLTGMFWRFYPASEDDVDIMISRDCDSRLNEREKAAIDEWIEKGTSFHIMRDHPNHGVQILGGMWGVKYPKLKNMKELIDKFDKGDYYQTDQIFLSSVIYPLINKDSTIHDEFFAKLPFPKPRVGKQFVGEPFDEHDNPNQSYRDMIP